MNSFISWVGGKKALCEIIVACFPEFYERYIEVFGGAGWVLFRKKPTAFEVFNDFNSLLVNLYRFVRDDPEALINALRYALNSREDFNQIVEMFAKKVEMPDLKKAALFYEVIRLSYSSGCKSFACQPKNLWVDFPAIEAAHGRLRQTGVIIENRDFEKLIRLYDRPGSFFYLDPPYFGTEKCTALLISQRKATPACAIRSWMCGDCGF